MSKQNGKLTDTCVGISLEMQTQQSKI